MDAIDQHGPLLTQVMASNVMQVSRQRVHQLVNDGKLASVEVNGTPMVPVAAVEAWMAEETKAGRPRSVTLKAMMKHAFNERAKAKKAVEKKA